MTASEGFVPAVRRTPAGYIVLLVAGSLLTLLGFWLFLGGIVGAAVVGGQGGGGFLTSSTGRFVTDGRALTTPSATGFSGEGRTVQLPFDIGRVRLRAEGEKPLFIGIASRADVQRYLSDVQHAEVTNLRFRPFGVDYRDVPGTKAPGDPAAQTFWVASSSGSGEQTITWTIQAGDWMVVLMNEDGSAGVSARVDAGFHSALLAPIAAGVGVTGLVLLLVGVPLLLLGAAGVGRSLPRSAETPTMRSALDDTGPRPLPVRVTGWKTEPLSRWLWLVKWLLAVPHYLVLTLLWVAFLVSTTAAGCVILFTGRYPRSLFEFNVAVLRWSWRVGFYAYSALGTDRYPPFTFAGTDYPADLQVDYPERLSNGLVLVKWWLLAIPHYLVLAALTGGAIAVPAVWPALRGGSAAFAATSGVSLLSALVLIAAVILLFTRRYPDGLFDLVVGVDRWAYRVAAYASLMRDEYPPFRLDQGPDEPVRTPVPAGPMADPALASR
ncbi:MAG: hypothetical protein QOE37_126 [Microbacteriaceae bacterium]|jgi:hypothetical protein|nr:hypothetical protein [Microbacteriaceae bacterium]